MELAIGLYKRHLIKGLTAWVGKKTVCRANKMGTLSACDMPEARRTAQAECVTVCP